jgi:hypothetical protein
MGDAAGTDATNLTGVWQGLFTYPSRNRRVMLGATLIETARWLSGSTNEICTTGRCRGDTILATLLGERNGNSVTFRKTY